MENYEIVYLSSLLNEKAGDFIQEELKKYGYAELKMAHGDIFHTLFEAGELSAKEIAERTRRSKSTVSEKGVAFEAVFRKISEDLSKKILSALGHEELKTAEKIMRKLTSNF